MSRRTFLSAAFALCALAIPRPAEAGSETYIALGDSLAFGETDFTHNPSFGDRGYVAPFADFLATINGGVRPNVINLGVDNETTTTFFMGAQPGSPTFPLLNLNYTAPPAIQNDLFLAKVAAEQAAGHTVGVVSFALGSNDLYQAATAPGFSNLTPAQQVAVIEQTLGTIQANYTRFLTELREVLPNALLILPNQYNPFAAIPDNPLAALAPIAIQALNQVVAGEAAAFGGVYVDVYSAFSGHEGEYTYVLDPPAGSNVHPNALGYSVMADQIIGAIVPEPASMVLLAIGAVGVLVLYRFVPRVSRFEV